MQTRSSSFTLSYGWSHLPSSLSESWLVLVNDLLLCHFFYACGVGKHERQPNSERRGHRESKAEDTEILAQNVTENQQTVMALLHDIILLLGLNGSLYFLTRPVNALSV